MWPSRRDKWPSPMRAQRPVGIMTAGLAHAVSWSPAREGSPTLEACSLLGSWRRSLNNRGLPLARAALNTTTLMVVDVAFEGFAACFADVLIGV